MKPTLAILSLLCLTSPAWADRALYTSECVEYATLIGVWGPDDIESIDSVLRLKRPSQVLKGDANTLLKVKRYSSQLNDAITAIAKDPQSRVTPSLILFINVNGDSAELVNLSEFVVPYSDIAMKTIHAVISQLELKSRWTALSIDEQVQLADLIVSGRISPGDEKCPTTLTVEVDTIYQGLPLGSVSGRRIEVVDTAEELVNLNALMFIQRQLGTGPDYVVMHAIPLENANEHLRKLKPKPAVDLKAHRFDALTGTVPPSNSETTSSLIACVRNSPLRDDLISGRHRAAAIDILGQRKAKEAIPVLIHCLNDRRTIGGSDNWVGHHAASALSAITGRPFSLDETEWRAWLGRQDRRK